jgi:hypothetical protein
MAGALVNVTAPMLTASAMVGTPDGDQLLAVFQSVLVVPFQVYVVADAALVHSTVITITATAKSPRDEVNAVFIKG